VNSLKEMVFRFCFLIYLCLIVLTVFTFAMSFSIWWCGILSGIFGVLTWCVWFVGYRTMEFQRLERTLNFVKEDKYDLFMDKFRAMLLEKDWEKRHELRQGLKVLLDKDEDLKKWFNEVYGKKFPYLL
jgi:hypothetical protein